MKVKFSETSVLPMYSSLAERQSAWCLHTVPVLIFPSWADVNVMFCFDDEDPSFVGISVFDENGNNVPSGFDYDLISEDTNNDGTIRYYLRIYNVTWGTAPSGKNMSLRISINGGSDDYYSEDFKICAASYRIEYWNDCSNVGFGAFDDNYKNKLFLKDYAPRRQKNEEEIEDRKNGYNIAQNIFTSVYPVYTGEVYGADYFYDIVNYIKYHDNVQLINQTTGEVWNISQIVAESGQDACAYPMPISFKKNIIKKLVCGASVYENAPYDDPDEPPVLDCTGFGVTISESGGILSYSISNNPDTGLSITQYWTRNGSIIGTGSTIALNEFGVYGLIVRIGTCSATDSYQYLNACVMSTQIAVNDTTINAATSNPPTSVSYELYNSSGSLISSSLPYDVVTSGLYTLKTISGSCEIINQIQVNSETGNIDCDFTFDLDKDASDLLTVSNVSEGTYSVEWLKIIKGEQTQSVGTGDTHQIDGSGLFIARVTANGCAQDKLYVYLSPAEMIDSNGAVPKYHQNEDVTGANYDFTDFELPNPHIHSESEINALLKVFINKQKYTYKDTPSQPTDFGITVSNTDNKIVPQITFANDDIEIYRYPL